MDQNKSDVLSTPEKVIVGGEKAEIEIRGLEVIDRRENPDVVQSHLLSERIKTDRVVETLEDIKKMLGSYATDAVSASIPIVLSDGQWGSGKYANGVLEVALPADQEVVELMKPFAESLKIPGEEIENVAREVANAALSSTVLHEATHVLIDSRPGSILSRDLGVEDPNGEISTMIDEGITYALQGIYAKETYLIPDEKQDEGRQEVRFRKVLGVRIRPRVKELLDSNKIMDKEFLRYCLETLEQVKAEG